MEDNVQQQVMPVMNVGQAGCSTRRRCTAKGYRGRGRGRGTGRVEFMRHPVDTEYATRSVSEDKVSSAWRLFIDDSILRHIKRYTEAEAAIAGEQNWSLAIEELDAFIALVYAWGAYGCRSVDYDVLWNVNWGLRFFPDTLSRNIFREIMRYPRSDLKRTRSHRLQSDKFALCKVTNLHWLLKYVRGSLITAFSATDLGRILLQMSNSFHLKTGADLPNTWRTNLTSMG